MRIFDIINKLENIKHNYLIYALEKYTDQITSEDIKKKEEERKKQEEVAKEEIKKPVEEVKKPVEEVKKPVEEVKKPVEEVKKFENNIMDSLKWVFISIGIFLFLMVVLSLIYWFMSSSNNEQNINTPDNANQYVTPPVNQYVTPPINQYVTPPINQYVTPLVNQHVTPPVNQYVTPPVNQYVTPPVNQYVTPPKNIDNAKESQESIFSFLTPFSKNEKPPEIISKTKAPTEVDLEQKPISETRLISKAQSDTEAYLENISKSSKSDTNKIYEENNISKLILSPVKEVNNINEYKKEVSKV